MTASELEIPLVEARFVKYSHGNPVLDTVVLIFPSGYEIAGHQFVLCPEESEL